MRTCISACAALVGPCALAAAAPFVSIHQTFDAPAGVGTVERRPGNNAGLFRGLESEVVSIPTARSLTNNASAVTLSAWIKPSAIEYGHSIIFASLNSSSLQLIGRAHLMLLPDGANNHRFTLLAEGAKRDAKLENGVEESRWDIHNTFAQRPEDWHHVAATFDYVGNAIHLYVNGKREASSIDSLEWSDTGPRTNASDSYQVTVGTGFNFPGYGALSPFKGAIDDASIYKALLTPAQILAMYELDHELGLDVTHFNALAGAHEDGTDVVTGGHTWVYSNTLASGEAGRVTIEGGQSIVRFTPTSGMVAAPEPHALALLPMVSLLLRRRRH